MKKPNMTAHEFRVVLEGVKLTEQSFAHLLRALGDPTPDIEHHVRQWASGETDIPGPAIALLTFLAVLEEQQEVTPTDIWSMILAATPKVPTQRATEQNKKNLALLRPR
jgi:hypothetical protein